MVFNIIIDRFQQFRGSFHNYVCICTLLPHLILSQVQSLKSNQDNICCCTSPFLLPILCEVLIGLSACQEHQMSVTWVSGNSRASGHFGSEGIASGAVVSVAVFGGHHPNLPLCL